MDELHSEAKYLPILFFTLFVVADDVAVVPSSYSGRQFTYTFRVSSKM